MRGTVHSERRAKDEKKVRGNVNGIFPGSI